jgi:transcriptional regulator with XRE-family HTH domain
MQSKKEILETFAERVFVLRNEWDLSQEALAQLIGSTESAICCYEKARRSPTLHLFLRLTQALDVSADYLVGNSHQKNALKVEAQWVEFFEKYKSLDERDRKTLNLMADAFLSKKKEA